MVISEVSVHLREEEVTICILHINKLECLLTIVRIGGIHRCRLGVVHNSEAIRQPVLKVLRVRQCNCLAWGTEHEGCPIAIVLVFTLVSQIDVVLRVRLQVGQCGVGATYIAVQHISLLCHIGQFFRAHLDIVLHEIVTLAGSPPYSYGVGCQVFNTQVRGCSSGFALILYRQIVDSGNSSQVVLSGNCHLQLLAGGKRQGQIDTGQFFLGCVQ